MHTTLKSALLAASMLLCVSAQAAVADSINQDKLPAVVDNSFGPFVDYSPQTFFVDAITYQYTPSFDYTLTGLYTRFATAGVVPEVGFNKILVSIYGVNPQFNPAAASLLSFSFDLKPGGVDLLPNSSFDVNEGTDWLGSSSLAPLSLSASSSYFIRLNALSAAGAPMSIADIGVNFVSPSDWHDNPMGASTTWLPTFVNSGNSPTAEGPALYADPIFRFEGVSAVPEPSTYGLIGAFGLMGFVAVRRRLARKS